MKRVDFLITIVILITIQTPVISHAQNYDDVVYLKNGSIIKGNILEINVYDGIKIKTSDDNILIFKMSEIERIVQNQNKTDRLIKLNKLKVQLDDYNGRKTRDFILVLTTYCLTIGADAAIGGDLFVGSFVPVVGPFFTLNEFGSYPNADTHKALMILSGTIQTIFFIDYFYAKNKASSIRNKINLVYKPYNKELIATISVNF